MTIEKIDYCVGKDYWKIEAPELKQEIPELLAVAGKVKSVKPGFLFDSWFNVTLRLHQPAKVINWQTAWGDGVAINEATFSCIRHPARMLRLPKGGDLSVSFVLECMMDVYTEVEANEPEAVLVERIRQNIREFATAITKTWYYHFK